MHGARGLLISITGGRDLTLFEVDEAATRIREEVDQDANIILGATFDENLEGVIRVSVVATGIDKAESVFGDTHHVPEVVASAPRTMPAAEVHAVRPAATASAAPRHPMPLTVDQDEAEDEVEADFTAALEAEIAQVSPPVAGHSPSPRMPRVEDFPPTVRAEIESRAAAEGHGDERGPMGLLRRLTTGLSRREDEETAGDRHFSPAPEQPRRATVEPNPYAPRRLAAESAARPAAAVRPSSDDDQLEIPAFLRRQSN